MIALLLLLCAALAGPPDPRPPDAAPPGASTLSDPDALAALAVQAHPDLAAASARLAAARAEAEVAGLLPDPMLGVEYMHGMPGDTGGDHQGGLALMARQELPLPGVLHARRQAARAGLAVVEAERAEVQAALIAGLHVDWWTLALVRARRAVDQEALDRLGELEAVVRSRYETGEAGASALLRVDLLRDQLALDLRMLEVDEAGLLAALARAAAVEALDLRTDSPTALPVPGTPEAWLARAGVARPALAGRAAEAEAMRRVARVARAEGWTLPAVTAGLETGMGGAGALYRVGVELPLALSSGRVGRAMEGAALQRAAEAETMRRSMVDELRAELTAAHATWSVAAERARVLTERLLPQAERALGATLSDYRVGRAPFADLVDAELALLDLERMRLLAATETRVQQARVAGMLGLAPSEL